ncbi:MAG: hypothetical protein ACD_75C01933G0003 [uncultured bacterium]|nr:MAG: hypothetical protein ACD_75C01933G0003 [uncultured bacterium]
MKVIQARIRGLGPTIESKWFDLSPHLNLFHYHDDLGRAAFLRTLATINPPSSCRSAKTFADFPLFIDQQGHTRRIRPEKRTVALAIFNATPDLVKELAAIDQHLYETDRIEVGRRLDCSRWINFVEIASSTRWSEISSDIKHLIDLTEKNTPNRTGPFATLVNSLKASDRIKDGLDYRLAGWLTSLPDTISAGSPQLIETMLDAVRRAEHFHRARSIVERRLPLFIVLKTLPNSTHSTLMTLQAATLLAIAFGRVTCQTEPVLLFNSPERFLPAALHPELADFILRIALFCQCLYGYAAIDIFPEDREIKRYTISELALGQGKSHLSTPADTLQSALR